ncbi:hypothetical protein BGZ82_005991 [Podila clonocystis]|nr:hypothetical protein BGZ82_005991 [Podila clonocystis]
MGLSEHLLEYECDFATSAFFITLPSDLDSWNDSDPLTHQFRFYFLCEHWNQNGSREDLPQHVHLSNHAGYSLKRPSEFFQDYGDYVLRLLRMIKHGYTIEECDIPPLDTFKILWSHDHDTSSNYLTKDTIGSLIDKAISYIEKLSPPKWKTLALTRDQSRAINAYLDIEEGYEASCCLHRYIHNTRYVSWMCGRHAHQFLNREALKGIEQFVIDHGGLLDMHQAVLKVELGSTIDADRFQRYLIDVNFPFHCIFIKLNWMPTRTYVTEFFREIGLTGVVLMEIDGITLDMHPQGSGLYMTNFFVDIIESTGLQFISLLNYPGPLEQCIHIGKTCLQSKISPQRSTYSWVDVRFDLMRFGKSLSTAQVASDCSTVARQLRAVLEKHGQRDVTLVTIYRNSWNVVFDLEKGTCVEAYSQEEACPKGVLASGSLRTLVVSLNDLQQGQDFFRMVQNNTDLEDLSISHCGNDVLQYSDRIVRMWRESSCLFNLTLVDRMLDSQGRVFAQLSVNRSCSNFLGYGAPIIHGDDSNKPATLDEALDIDFELWECDHVFASLSDYSALFLDLATKQHPSILTLLTLDISQLSRTGLASVKKVLGRSTLEHLNIVCTHFDSRLSNVITQVLGSIQWGALKSLVISGSNIDEWLQLWPHPQDAHLLCLQIQGSRSNIAQKLSHSSVLFLDQVIFSSPLVELHLKNVELEDECDWEPIVEGMDFLLLEILDISAIITKQLNSGTNALGLFVDRIEAAKQEGKAIKLILPVFTLDILTLSMSDQSLFYAQKVLNLCSVEDLYVKCPPFDPCLSNAIVQLLGSVQWCMLKVLGLYGDNLEQWIQLLAPLAVPRLRSLVICGTVSAKQELSHSSVLFIQQLIDVNTMERLRIANIQVQYPQDRVLLVEHQSFGTER